MRMTPRKFFLLMREFNTLNGAKKQHINNSTSGLDIDGLP